MGCILITGVLVGVQTNEALMVKEDYPQFNRFLEVWDAWLMVLFTSECILKIISFQFRPLKYFKDSWNIFDFIIVAGSYLPSAGNMLMMLRLLRVLLILKMVRSIPELRVAVVSLIQGAASIGYIGLSMLVVFYFFAIFGFILFSQNDPWHFGNLHLSMLTLFRCATLEDWTDVMYVNMYGCDMYGYDAEPSMERVCLEPHAHGYVAVVYFMIITVINALILLNLFIGVISTSMEEATQDLEKEERINVKVKEMTVQMNISKRTVSLYQQVFKYLDTDRSGQITVTELKVGLDAAGLTCTTEMLTTTMSVIDKSGDSEIDFAEFLEFMHYVRDAKEFNRRASIKDTLQEKTEGSASLMLTLLRREIRLAQEPYFAYVGKQLIGELKEYGMSATEEIEHRQHHRQKNAKMMLTCAGLLEAFLRANRDEVRMNIEGPAVLNRCVLLTPPTPPPPRALSRYVRTITPQAFAS